MARVLSAGRPAVRRVRDKAGVPAPRRGRGPLAPPRRAGLLWPRDRLWGAAGRDGQARLRIRRSGRQEGRPGRAVSSQQPAVRDRLFRRAEERRRRHQHQPALHEPRGSLPTRRQRRARRGLPGRALRQGGEVRRASRRHHRHRRGRVSSSSEAASRQDRAGAAVPRSEPGLGADPVRARTALAAGPPREVPAPPAAGQYRSEHRPGRPPLYRWHHRPPQRGDAHAREHARGRGAGKGQLSGIRRRQGSGDRVPALLPHLRAGGDHARRPVPGGSLGALHLFGHGGDSLGDGALPGHRVLRRSHALRVPQGPPSPRATGCPRRAR